jgi:hypothetical protein
MLPNDSLHRRAFSITALHNGRAAIAAARRAVTQIGLELLAKLPAAMRAASNRRVLTALPGARVVCEAQEPRAGAANASSPLPRNYLEFSGNRLLV